MRNYLIKITISFIITGILSYFLVMLMKKVAKHIGALDIPKDDRRVHKNATPRLGGVGMLLSFLLSYLIFGTYSEKAMTIIIGAIFIVLVGIVDDINPLFAKEKFIGQFIAASIPTIFAGLLLDEISALGLTINFGIFAYPITIIFLVACINIINLIDGLDGLSGGISFIFFGTIAVISLIQGRFGTLEIMLSLIMMGSIIGFLFHNFHPATIFAGDSGAMFMGYMIGTVSLLGFKGTLFKSILIPLVVIFIPILDTLFAIIRRKINNKPVFEADKDHLHHQLLKKNISQSKTVLIIYAVCILFSLISIFQITNNFRYCKYIYIILLVLIGYLIGFTNIIFKESILDRLKKYKK